MTSDQFLDSVAVAAGLDREQAEWTTTAVLRRLKERLSPEECGHLATWLPEPMRHLIQKGASTGKRKITREELVDRVCHALDVDVREALKRIRSVYLVLERAVGEVAPDEIAHLERTFPPELRAVFHTPGSPR